jgi:hypothetical protein
LFRYGRHPGQKQQRVEAAQEALHFSARETFSDTFLSSEGASMNQEANILKANSLKLFDQRNVVFCEIMRFTFVNVTNEDKEISPICQFSNLDWNRVELSSIGIYVKNSQVGEIFVSFDLLPFNC